MQNLSISDNRALLLHYATARGLPHGSEAQLRELMGGEEEYERGLAGGSA